MKRLNLFRHRIYKRRMGVTQGAGGNARHKVEVAVAACVPKAAPLSTGDRQGKSTVGRHDAAVESSSIKGWSG